MQAQTGTGARSTRLPDATRPPCPVGLRGSQTGIQPDDDVVVDDAASLQLSDAGLVSLSTTCKGVSVVDFFTENTIEIDHQKTRLTRMRSTAPPMRADCCHDRKAGRMSSLKRNSLMLQPNHGMRRALPQHWPDAARPARCYSGPGRL